MPKIAKPTPAQLEEWDGILAAHGLSIHAGNTHHNLIYVESTDLYQTKQIRPRKGGRLRKYGLGDKPMNPLVCQECKKTFFGRRKTTRYCSAKCRDKKIWTKNVKCGGGLEDGESQK